MSTLVILGAQWGDEGKGKITDYLAKKADMVVRYQGGDNAGHTVEIGENKYKLHLIPSGIFYDDKTCVLGNGLVINPKSLIKEIKYLNDRRIDTKNLKISNRAHIIFPYHLKLDELEEQRKGENKIGTTIKGVGPCYRDKADRIGLRMCDIFHKEYFENKLRENINSKNEIITKIYGHEPLDADEIIKEYLGYLNQLKPYITDTNVLLNNSIQENENILFEGAQGTLLDIDFGTYPYLTSSHPISGGVSIGSGISPFNLHEALGVVKAYTTRVGRGPFPTELNNAVGDEIREKGREFGTTTGRSRRCGWLDIVMLKYSTQINGFTSIAVTKLDTLAGFDKLKICVGYELDGKVIDTFPASLETLAKCKPIYEEVDGWSVEDMNNIKEYEDLPAGAKNYVRKIEELTDVKVSIASIGPRRSETLIRQEFF